MLSTTEKHIAITTEDGSFKVMNELFEYMDATGAIEVLTGNMNADLGNVELGEYGAITIHHQVANTARILRFLRKFPQELSEVFVSYEEDEDLMLIQEAFDNFSYEAADQVINDGLSRWIYGEGNENVCIDYVSIISTVYKQTQKILTMSFAYYEPIVLGTSEKGAASC